MINLAKTWEKLMLAARIIVAIENPADGTNSGHHPVSLSPHLTLLAITRADCVLLSRLHPGFIPAAMPSTRHSLLVLRVITREVGKRRSTDEVPFFLHLRASPLSPQCASSRLAPTASALCSSSGSTPVQTTWPAATRPVFCKHLFIVSREMTWMCVACLCS